MSFTRKLYIFAILIVIMACLTPETDARRKILRGRKTVTRTYYRPAIMPAWALMVIVGFLEIIAGAIFYVVLKKVILDKPVTGSYAPATVHHVGPSV